MGRTYARKKMKESFAVSVNCIGKMLWQTQFVGGHLSAPIRP